MPVKRLAQEAVTSWLPGPEDVPASLRCDLCGSAPVQEGLALLTENDGPEPSSHIKFHREVHRLKWAHMALPGGAVPLAREVATAEGQLALREAEIGARESLGRPVPAAWRELVPGLKAQAADRRAILEKLPLDARRDLETELDAAWRAQGEAVTESERYGRAPVPDEAGARLDAAERGIVELSVEIELRDRKRAELDGLLRQTLASAIHALQSSLSGFVAGVLALRVKQILRTSPRLFELFPARVPGEIEVICRLAERAEDIGFRLGGDGPRVDKVAILDGLRPALQAAVAARACWRLGAVRGRARSAEEAAPPLEVESGVGDLS